MTRVAKAVAYVVDGDRLLVFVHRDEPLTESGVQVPAGTVRDGETPYDAVLREAREETGRDGFVVRRFLGTADYAVDGATYVRHFFELAPTEPLPERWESAELHDGTRAPTPFECFWIPLANGHVLAGGLSAMMGAMGSSTPFADVFVEDDPRVEVPDTGGERELLDGFLRWQRETLELKCSGLTPEQLASRPLALTSMSLLGLVRHLADVERGWFRRRLAGEDAPPRFSAPDDRDGAFDNVTPDGVTEAWAAWREEVAYAEAFAAADDLDRVAAAHTVSLRWVLLHMVEEYARHMGHADLLRQAIDGRVGQ